MTGHRRPSSTKETVAALKQQPTADLHAFLINQGRGFTVSDRVNDLGNGNSLYIYLENDSTGIDYDVVVLPRATGRADLDISFNATQGDTGDSATVHNLKSGSSRTFSGIAELSTTGDTGTLPSHGTTFIEDFIPGDGTGANIGGEVIDTIAFTIDEGDNKLLELRNESGGQVGRIGLNVLIFEVIGEFKEMG